MNIHDSYTNAVLVALRQEMEQPCHGRPARYEIQFNPDGKHEEAVRWWQEEAQPIMKNMTGDQIKIVGLFSAYTDNKQEAILISMMLYNHIIGILDWDEISWVELRPKTESIPVE